MRVAALYDVHGNLPALEAVLAELEGGPEPVEAIVCGGDILAGPCQAECVALLRERGARFIAGNSEREVLTSSEDRNPWWRARLSEALAAEVHDWPQQLRLDGVLYCHASPRSDEETLTVLTPEAVIADALGGVTEPTVVIGHTHAQFDRRVAGRPRLVNAGSVGRPYEGRAAAFWAVIGDELEFRATEYDIGTALRRMRATGMPGLEDDFAESLLQPMPRDEVAAIFERQAGREPTQSSVSVIQNARPANSR